MIYMKLLFILLMCVQEFHGQKTLSQANVAEVFSWKQISYEIDGVLYNRDTDTKLSGDGVYFEQELEESEKYFIQYNNVPIGFEVCQDKVFVTVPRRRYGIPSTLNYVTLASGKEPVLRPYPASKSTKEYVSIYRPRVDVCGRLWAVDTGLLEVPGNRIQIQKPSIVIFDLKTDQQILKYELKDSDLINERTPGGLTSITIDVTKDACDDAFAYINDLATEGLIVFSLKTMDSWRVQHPSFAHDEAAVNFTVAGFVIPWKDGVFSIALSEPSPTGSKTVYYHAFASRQEFSIESNVLKRRQTVEQNFKLLGTRGNNSQSGSHGYHKDTRTIFYANAPQDAILCWRVDSKMAPENVAIAVQNHFKLVYISDLKVIGDEVWVLVNQMPRIVYSTLNPSEVNFYIMRAKVNDLLRGTVCDRKNSGKDKITFGYRP